MKKITFDYIVKVLKTRPLMIVQDYNVFYLYHLIFGVLHSKDNTELTTIELSFKQHFEQYVHNYYNDNSTRSWAHLIWYNSGGHKEALEKFNALYAIFISEFKN